LKGRRRRATASVDTAIVITTALDYCQALLFCLYRSHTKFPVQLTRDLSAGGSVRLENRVWQIERPALLEEIQRILAVHSKGKFPEDDSAIIADVGSSYIRLHGVQSPDPARLPTCLRPGEATREVGACPERASSRHQTLSGPTLVSIGILVEGEQSPLEAFAVPVPRGLPPALVRAFADAAVCGFNEAMGFLGTFPHLLGRRLRGRPINLQRRSLGQQAVSTGIKGNQFHQSIGCPVFRASSAGTR